MKVPLLSTLALLIVAPALAVTTNSITFSVRLENGANQTYRLDVPPDVPPTLGGGKPGGFYNATHIKVNSVQSQASPVPYYLVQMEGNIGQSIQTFYAAVLDDGRIVEPTVVGATAAPQKMKTRGHGKH